MRRRALQGVQQGEGGDDQDDRGEDRELDREDSEERHRRCH
jgi:hypothetical protein